MLVQEALFEGFPLIPNGLLKPPNVGEAWWLRERIAPAQAASQIRSHSYVVSFNQFTIKNKNRGSRIRMRFFSNTGRNQTACNCLPCFSDIHNRVWSVSYSRNW